MKAIILAAGYATRLYPLTKNRPKALLKINGKSILDYICDEIDTLEAVDEIILISNHRFIDSFKTWAGKRAGEKSIKVIDDGTDSEEGRLGAIGDISLVIGSEKINDDILVVAGDNFFTFKMLDFYNHFLAVKRDCVIIKEMDRQEDLQRMGVVVLDENSLVVDFEEKPKKPKTNLGVYASYIYVKETLALFDVYLKLGGNPDAPGNFPAWLYKRKEVSAYKMDGDCYDIGTHEALAEVRQKFRTRVK